MTRVWRIERGRDEMHALQMLGYGPKSRQLRRRRIAAMRWPLRWPFGGYRG